MNFLQKVARFTPWGACTPTAIPQQLLARVQDAVADKHEVCVFAVLVVKNERGNWVYTVTSTASPAEVGLMAAHMLQEYVTHD